MGEPEPLPPGHFQAVTTLAFAPDGRWLATGSLDRTAHVWDLTAPGPADAPLILTGHTDVIQALAFTPDGQFLATAGGVFLENTARLWDLAAADPATQPVLLPGQEAVTRAMAVAAGSRWLVQGGEDGRLRFWRLPVEELMDSACQAAGRNLRRDEWDQYFPGEAYRQTCPQWPAAGTLEQEIMNGGAE